MPAAQPGIRDQRPAIEDQGATLAAPTRAGLARRAARLLDRCGVPKLRFRRQTGLRILCYHGVCPDDLIGAPWLPPHFVGVREFARQMQTVCRWGPVVHLPEVVEKLIAGAPPTPPALAITFDDVAAGSFVHARPLLNAFGIRASFFVCTGHVTTGRLFNGDLLRLLRWQPELIPREQFDLIAWLVHRPGQHKRLPWEHLRAPLDAAEATLRSRLEPSIRELLRPMNWEEVAQLAAEGHEIGGHTVDHVNLGWQPDDVRRQQIHACVADLEERLCRKVVGFAYPNGQCGDFAISDYEALREVGVRYAVTTRPGFAAGAEIYALPRVCIGAGHDAPAFTLELCGALDRHRRRQQKWL